MFEELEERQLEQKWVEQAGFNAGIFIGVLIGFFGGILLRAIGFFYWNG